MLPGAGVLSHIGHDIPVGHCIPDLGGTGRLACPGAIGRGHQVSILIDELQFHLEVDITDKVTIIALISALIIGSSVVSFGPRAFDIPIISLIGYIIAIILSIIGIRKFVLN